MNEILNTDVSADDSKEISKTTGKNYIGTKIDTDADLKEALNSSMQQGVNQETCKVTSRNPQRNCPKVKNDDFFMELKTNNKSKSMNNITLYHQNVRSLTNKIDELSIIMQKNYIGPHFICLTEHHLKETEITKISFEGAVGKYLWEEEYVFL